MRLHFLLVFACISSAWADELASQAVAILKKNCTVCHGGGLKASNLDMTTREGILAGGERGEGMVPNYPERSRLYQLATHRMAPAMPPGGKLKEDELETLRRWILAGSPWPADAVSPTEAEARAAMLKMEERPVTAEERQFWSFRAPVRHAVPGKAGANAVDAFLAKTWAAKNLKASPKADKRTLVRRAYLDLTGLPPTPAEISAFLSDTSPKAWEKLIDKLLASPHYGERWARYWLDLVRYADSGGYEYDREWPAIHRYRDWVVKSFQNDKPYNRFVVEQIAGDELDNVTDESRVGTGYLRLGPENNIKSEATRLDELDDIVSVTAQSFLGMTLGCARCHNHKFDPIPQKDYYRMQAVFFSTKAADHPLVAPDEVARFDAAQKRIDDAQAPLKKQKTALEKPYRDAIFEEKVAKLATYMQEAWRTPADKRTEGQRLNARQIERTLEVKEDEIVARMSAADKASQQELGKSIAALEKQRPKPYDSAMVIAEQGRDAVPSYFLHRGNPGSKGSRVEPGVLTAASWTEFQPMAAPANAATSFRRRGFAEWLVDEKNPLTSRVMVNRIWQHHFGEGIVRTPNNFGKKGEPPTHPELLDWLATEFVGSGWSVKSMHRLLMTSDAYQMASEDTQANRAIDPTNHYLWRQGRTRLDIETIRDAMMAVAGTLDRTVGGAAVYPYIDPALFQSSSRRTWNGKPDDDRSTWRRSIYVFNKRSIRYPLFESFDQPDMITSCGRRNTSVTAPQALLMMNNASVRLHARHFAERLTKEAGADAAAQVKLGFDLALGRAPRGRELDDALAFVKAGENGLADFCQALFNLNEFVFTP